jgi:hypothetical protein
MSQGTMAKMGTLGIEMRESQILAAVESLPGAAPADASLRVKNGGNDDTSRSSTITHTTFNFSAVRQEIFNSYAAGFEARSQALN